MLLSSAPDWIAGFLCGRRRRRRERWGLERRGWGRKVAANHRARLVLIAHTHTHQRATEDACGQTQTHTNITVCANDSQKVK